MTRAILLVDHGSRRDSANDLLRELADRVRERLPDQIVEIAHMEIASPSIAHGIAACVAAGAEEVVVHPYFLGDGLHTTETIPHLVKEAARSHVGLDIRITRPLGIHPKLVDVVLEHIDEA